jgi:hypothetical protein
LEFLNMPRKQWPLATGRPVLEIEFTLTASGQAVVKTLLADTGAGSDHAGFELILDEQDCVASGGIPCPGVNLGGAYQGAFPVYLVRVQIPSLNFDQAVRAVGAPQTPADLDGIACFRFLNRFSYGNFGDASCFALEL